MEKIKTVCVFCASSPHISQIYKEEAFLLGKLLAANGVDVITGGGSKGLMASVTDGVIEGGGNITAVIPGFMVDAGWLHKGIGDVVVTADMQERKKIMIERSDAVIALPGGCGTLDELAEVLTLKQLGILSSPIILLNTDGFYNLLVSHLKMLADYGFMSPDYVSMWSVASNPHDVIDIVSKPVDCGGFCGKLSINR